MTVSDLTTGAIGTVFAELECDEIFVYNGNLNPSSKAAIMLFGNYDAEIEMYEGPYYWLATTAVHTGDNVVAWGVYETEYSALSMWHSDGSTEVNSSGVRAVVSLAADIAVTGNSTDGWSY